MDGGEELFMNILRYMNRYFILIYTGIYIMCFFRVYIYVYLYYVYIIFDVLHGVNGSGPKVHRSCGRTGTC